MEVRLCTEEDLEVLERDLPTGLARVHEKHLLRAKRQELSYLGAWDGDRVVGTGVILWNALGTDPSRCGDCAATPEIAHLQVDPVSQGRGVGTALIKHGEQLAKAAAHRSVIIGVSSDNERAARLYERLGYTPTGAIVVSDYTWTDTQGIDHSATETNTILRRQL